MDISTKHDDMFAVNPKLAWDRLRADYASQSCEGAAMREALERLARLGNELNYGNSTGNTIAQAVLKKLEPVSEELPQDDGEGQAAALSEIDR